MTADRAVSPDQERAPLVDPRLVPIPLTIVTGFLGSGKTTLLNRFLKTEALRHAVVIVNEFGDVGIDHHLMETVDDGPVLLSSGCLCCTIRGDLIATLEDLLRRRDNGRMPVFDRVLIETTGLADPTPILHTVMGHGYLHLRYRLEGVVTLIDAVNGLATLDAQPEAVKQVAVADRLLLSKIDIAAPEAVSALRIRLTSLNPAAPILDLRQVVSPTAILNCGLYDPDSKRPDVRRWLNEEALAEIDRDHHDREDVHDHHGHAVRHDEAIRAFAFRSEEPISPDAFALFIELLATSQGPRLLRVKGLACLADDPGRPMVVQGAQHVFHPPIRLERWPDDDHATRMVFIVRDLDRTFIEGLWRALAKPVGQV